MRYVEIVLLKEIFEGHIIGSSEGIKEKRREVCFTIPQYKLGYDVTNAHIYPPGNYYNTPHGPLTLVDPSYHVIDIPINVVTSDGLTLIYHFELFHYTWEPHYYLSTYQANESQYIATQIAKLTPPISAYIATLTEPQFVLNITDHQSHLDALSNSLITTTGLIHNPQIDYPNSGYFQYTSNPKFNYACTEFPELCALGDSYNLLS